MLAIALPCVLGATVITTIVALIVLVLCLKKNKTELELKDTELKLKDAELKVKAEQLAEKFINEGPDRSKSPKEKAEEFKDIFEMTYRTIAIGTDKSCYYVDTGKVSVKTALPLGAMPPGGRVATDDGTLQEPIVSISREWIRNTDIIFSSIRNEKKKSDLMHHLSSVIREENLLPRTNRQTAV